MTKDQAEQEMAELFAALPDEDLEALSWHEREGTPVCCGEDALLYYRPSDGGA